jgi:hypothetical protein
MVPRKLCTALVAATLLAWAGGSVADEYRSGELLNLDLSAAVLSPKPLGPAQNFAPVPVEARADRPNRAAQAPVVPKAEPRTEAKAEAKTEARTAAPKAGVAQARAEKPRGAARTRLARPRGNPLDAQASDTRIQVWPCKSGAICGWKR